MKTDWSKWSLTSDSAVIGSDRYATATTNTAINDDAYDAICSAIKRRMDMEKKKAIGVSFDKLEKTLREMGIFLTEVRQDSYNDYAEITCKVNPIDWYISLDGSDGRNIQAKKKDNRPHPKKVHFSGPATTILWTDGTKTTVKCQKEDVWSDEVGIAMCYLKKLLGNNGNYNNIFREAMKVAVVQHKKEELSSSAAIEGESYYSSALDTMRQNIDEINDFMKDAVDALDKVLGGKK